MDKTEICCFKLCLHSEMKLYIVHGKLDHTVTMQVMLLDMTICTRTVMKCDLHWTHFKVYSQYILLILNLL